MLQDYLDITRTLTRLMRQAHYYHYLWRVDRPILTRAEAHVGTHPQCMTFNPDLVDKPDEFSPDGKRCCTCVAKPLWWDQNGTPRFKPHHPDLCPDIYAIEVALLLISCQSCGSKYDVQMSWDLSDRIKARAVGEATAAAIAETALSAQIRRGVIHYGDPPCNNCLAGSTMNCWDLAVLQFWTREGRRGWERVPALEITLPDMNDSEREEP